ncbi:S1 family peptidase [Falsiroseomonas bella]|nr:serine protease [Falsiroseomonas bella]
MRVVPIPACRRGLSVALLAAALLGACARLPAEEARGTPAEAVAAQGFARLSATGLPLGSAVAVALDRLLTNAHVIPEGVEQLAFRRGDGAASGPARLLARSDRMDLAVLEVPAVFAPAQPAPQSPAEGDPLWAAGSPAAGPAVVAGRVAIPAATLPGHGPGFTARIGALLGYSGGPALDGQGRLLGLVTAVPQPGAAPLLAALSGVDLDGLARGEREVFLLGIGDALAEAARIAPR